ncbi:hypothetical protein JL475_32920 [Streptomyces sp. M2CJ-2]|uniref:hypothetical protein n=1 Tax=Streptomyces sp. M2CJ-2 TaxID=2803948 RepID=UPI0019271B0D|nr:hypothetical protein [Streptomyces sp. M2CJ-2]MBL3670687.1 hypothetical protein [Streptomyces sp. M2CJ-2]
MSAKKLVTAILLTSTLTACNSSHDGLSYTVPDNICGISTDKKILEALLDDGDKLEQDTGHFSLQEGQICHMYVDGNESVISDGEWHEKGYELRDYFLDYDVKGLRYHKKKFASWNSGVASAFPCPGVSKKGDVLSVEVSDMRWNDRSQRLLEKLAPAYFDAYKKKLGCQP